MVRSVRPEMHQSVCVIKQRLTVAALGDVATINPTSHPAPEENAVVEIIGSDGHVRSWSEIRTEILFKSMRACNFNVSQARTQLRIGRSTLYRWLSDPGQ